MKPQSNKGRITRVDQAWDAAHREALTRSRVADIKAAHGMAIDEDRQRFPTNVVPFVTRDGEVITASDGHFMQTTAQEDPEAPKLPGIRIPLKYLQAAILAAARDDVRYYLNAVYLHAVDGDWRICSTDGHRMVVTRFTDGNEFPDWSAEGVLIPRDELAQILPMLRRNGNPMPFGNAEPYAMIELVDGKIRVAAANAFCAFTFTPKDGKFPDYARVLADLGVTIARGEGEPMSAPAIATEYLRSAADVASRLGATAVHSFISAEDNRATFFTFAGAPDSCMVVMPVQQKQPAVSEGVVKILGSGGVAASIAAFRAHITRTQKLLGNTTDPREREALEARREGYEARVAELRAATAKQIEHKAA